MRKPYPSDLSDEQWEIIRPLIPVNQVGRPREVEMREVLNTIFYLNRSGCQWDMLPHDLLPKSTVYDYFAQWRDDGTWQRIVDALPEIIDGLITRAKEGDPKAALCMSARVLGYPLAMRRRVSHAGMPHGGARRSPTAVPNG